jgi:hypothetical protein
MFDPGSKECPACERINPVSARTCDCGFSFVIQEGDRVVGILGRPFFIRNGVLQAPFRYHVVFILGRLADIVPEAIRAVLWLVFRPVLISIMWLLTPVLRLMGRPARQGQTSRVVPSVPDAQGCGFGRPQPE